MSTRYAEKHKMVNTIFHLEDVETPPTPKNISHALREVNPWEKELERRGGPVEELHSIRLDDQLLERTIQIGSQLPGSLWDQLIDFLKKHRAVFGWSHEDTSDIDPSVIVHNLIVDLTYKLVIQSRHRFNPERYTVISKEVGKLFKAKFIKEDHYLEWLTNVVMVKKVNRKWRICIDYTDLNKACPKDSFSLLGLTSLWTPPSGMNY